MRQPATEDIYEMLPELEEIKDQRLREKTAKVWITAIERGGWSIDDLYDMPASTHLAPFDINLIEHVRSVTNVAIQATDTYQRFHPDSLSGLNRDHIVAGALLHDVGKTLEYARTNGEWGISTLGEYMRHPFLGAFLCDHHDLPPQVIYIVAVHSHEGDQYNRNPEATVVYHADFLNFDTAVRYKEIQS